MLLSDRAAGTHLALQALRGDAKTLAWYAGQPSAPRATKVLPARVEEARARASPVGMAVTQTTKVLETCEKGKEQSKGVLHAHVQVDCMSSHITMQGCLHSGDKGCHPVIRQSNQDCS